MTKYRLRDMREDRDLLQRDIAKILNTTQQHYSRMENGETEITADRIIKLSEFYHTSTDYILGITDERKPYPNTKIK